VGDLREAVQIVTGQAAARAVEAPEVQLEPWPCDLGEIRGQAVGRRALEIAAAGGHHLLFVGPPGCGKSMLAERLPSVLEPLDLETALEVAAVHSIAGARDPQAPLALRPPLRAPHHSTSLAGLVGGGVGLARPGEASLAHRGVLFLDELLEFPRNILDGLRQPLERGHVRIVRSAGAVRYPCDIQLVAATNPCPCGHLGSPARACRCRPDQIERYRARLSGPLLDRLDIQVELRPVDRDRLLGPAKGETSAAVAERVARARLVAADRWGRRRTNARASSERVRQTASHGALRELATAVDALGLSARGFDRVLRVSRTIADLAGHGSVDRDDVAEAVGYQLAAAGLTA
jgi:magnesium chelatase family protein